MANGQAYTSPTGSMRQTTRPAPQRLSPGSADAERGQVEEGVAGQHLLAAATSQS